MEFRLVIGNAGTGTCQRGAFEHGCEYAPVAGQYIYIIMPKFLVPLSSIIWHPSPTDDAVLLVKATERQFPHQEKPVSKNYWHFKEKNKILFLFQYLEIHFPISQSPNHGIIRIFRVIIRIIIFGTRASRSIEGRCITKVC